MKTFLRLLITAAFLFLSITLLQAQAPPHPNNGVAPSSGSGNTPVGAGAPVGSGNFLLIGLALLYATKKAAASSSIQADDNSIG
jgi:hypothetical protein